MFLATSRPTGEGNAMDTRLAPNHTLPLGPPRAPVRSPAAETVDAAAAAPGGAVAKATVLPKIVFHPGTAKPQLTRDDRPRYREETRLGAGGLGEVTLALDEDIGRHVAIKRLH